MINMSFLSELEKGTNRTYTANGAVSNRSTFDPLLDFFANAGAMRTKTDEAIRLFNNAYSADANLAMRTLFYLRDVRGGQGERAVFRAILDTLDLETIQKIAKFIPEYGRWDEVPLNMVTMPALYSQLVEDEANMKAGKPVSLLAKWLPSNNTSSAKTRAKAQLLIANWGLKPAQYRKRVAALRKYIQLLEQKMSSREWGNIDYSKLPTQAHRKHVAAFKRHDESRYESYLGKVEKGEAKINSATAFTYEIYDMVKRDYTGGQTRTADAMWKALPDYTNGQNALVMADVSGSMTGRPMSVSVSLAVYFAERNTGPFAGKYMTFTDIPKLVTVSGKDIKEKLNYVEQNHVGYNTDLHAAFKSILKAAQTSKATQDELPQVLYIISDMQFDSQMSNSDETNFETAKREFNEAGYELPHVVFWNVNSYGEDAPATKYDGNVTLISGSSQSTFQHAIAGKSPLQSMLDILNSDRYADISV